MAKNFTEVQIPCLAFAYHSPLKHYLPFFPLTPSSQHASAGNEQATKLKLQRKSYQHNAVITLNQAKGMPQCKFSICTRCTAPERVKRVGELSEIPRNKDTCRACSVCFEDVLF